MTANQFQMVLRITMQLRNGAIGKVSTGGNASSLAVGYSGNHIATFECPLKVPPAMALIDHSFKEYITAHRINFKHWRLVDLDNFMNGNPHFMHF